MSHQTSKLHALVGRAQNPAPVRVAVVDNAKAAICQNAAGREAPVVLTSRPDPADARLASRGVAALMLDRSKTQTSTVSDIEGSLTAAPQPEHICCAPQGAAAFAEAAE